MYFINSALEAPQGKAVKGRGKGPKPRGDLCSDSGASFTICVVLSKLLPTLSPSAQCPLYGVGMKSENSGMHKISSPVVGARPVGGSRGWETQRTQQEEEAF